MQQPQSQSFPHPAVDDSQHSHIHKGSKKQQIFLPKNADITCSPCGVAFWHRAFHETTWYHDTSHGHPGALLPLQASESSHCMHWKDQKFKLRVRARVPSDFRLSKTKRIQFHIRFELDGYKLHGKNQRNINQGIEHFGDIIYIYILTLYQYNI